MSARAEWLAERRKGIGGSDIAAVLGLSPWVSQVQLYLDKRGEAPEREGNLSAMRWGALLEDTIAREYADVAGLKVQRVNTPIVHPKHEWARANIDRAVVNPAIAGVVRWKDGRLTTDRILEVKTANAFAAGEWGESGSDLIPEHYLCQVQWYLGLTRADSCDVAVLIGGSDFRSYSVQRDDTIFDALLDAASEFWHVNVVGGIPPEPTSIADARALWRSHTTGKTAIADAGIADAVRDIARISAQIKELEADRDAVRALVMSAFEDAEVLTHMGDKLATWKQNKPTTKVDWQGAFDSLVHRIAETAMKGDDAMIALLSEATATQIAFTKTIPGPRVLRIAPAILKEFGSDE